MRWLRHGEMATAIFSVDCKFYKQSGCKGRKLRLLLLSKMEAQAENGAKNH